MSQHADTIQHYAMHPPRNEALTDATITYEENNRVCGDDITVYLKIEGDTLVDWAFTGNTAMITTACSALFGEIVVGQPLDTILSWDQDEIISQTQITVSPRRKRAQVLALLATRNAIHQHRADGMHDDFSDVIEDV